MRFVATRPGMHRTVRIYRSFGLTEEMHIATKPLAIADWRVLDWTLELAGAKTTGKIIAVGCEEGAMAVHIYGGH